MKTYTLAMIDPGGPIPVIAEDIQAESLDAALAQWHGFREATDAEYAIYEKYWNAFYDGCSTRQWKPSSGADEQHRDQEIDLGDGWWAAVGDEGAHWSWELNDHWLRDEAPSVAEGRAPDEAAAKRAALVAFATAPAREPEALLPVPFNDVRLYYKGEDRRHDVKLEQDVVESEVIAVASVVIDGEQFDLVGLDRIVDEDTGAASFNIGIWFDDPDDHEGDWRTIYTITADTVRRRLAARKALGDDDQPFQRPYDDSFWTKDNT